MSRIRLHLIISIVSILAGCVAATAPVRYYTLNTEVEMLRNGAEPPDMKPLSVGIGPIRLPQYLDRPQIVTRTGPNTVFFNEFHRWAGSLREEFTLQMRETLSVLLKTTAAAIFPWGDAFEPEVQIVVTVLRFDGQINDHVRLKGSWYLVDRVENRASPVRSFRIKVPVSEGGYEGFVHAQSIAVDVFSRTIADAVAARYAERRQ